MSRASLLLISTFALLTTSVFAADAAPKREKIEWCNIWVTETTKTDLPRVLLIGDSICNSYYDGVAASLKDKAYVAKLATSVAIQDPVYAAQLKLLLDNYKFAVVHFNYGLHGWDYTTDEYKKDFPAIVEIIKKGAPDAKLIWANSTPMKKNNAGVIERNKVVAELAAKENISLDNLYGVVENHPEFWNADGVHFNKDGQKLLAQQVAKVVQDAIAK